MAEPTRRDPGPDRVPVLYLGGIGRSGSTVLGRILGSFPEAVSLGEVVHLWERGHRQDQRCGCGEPFSACSFWLRVGEHAFGSWARVPAEEMVALQRSVDRNRYLPWLVCGSGPVDYQADLAEYRSILARLYDAAREVSGAQVLVDTSKNAPYAWLLRGVDSLDLRVVHLVRDSRGVAHSWSKTVVRPEMTHEVAYMDRVPPRRLAGRWVFDNTVFELLSAVAPVRRVRYEDLVTDPAPVVAGIAEFGGLHPAPALLDALTRGELQPSEQHEVSGNPLRFSSGPISLRPDVAWRREMPVADRRLVTALTLPLAWRYHYPVGRR